MVAQGLLAGAIAGALGAFCDINESMVESKLLDKKKITLTNVRLKPRVIRRSENYTLELHGKIKQGVFKWKWTGKGLLKGCTFTLAGLRVTIKPRLSGSSESEYGHEVTGKKRRTKRLYLNGGVKADSEEGKGGWKSKLVDNIVDQLKVDVEDFELVIVAPINSQEEDIPWKRQIRITGKNIELESLGRVYPKGLFGNSKSDKRNHKRAPLIQELSIGSISADIIVVNTNGIAQAFPLLHPFQYLMRAKRFFGKRFSGFTSGLEVEGLEILPSEQISHPHLQHSDSISAYESIVMDVGNVGVYADEEEIETSLCNEQLLNMSHSVSWEFGESNSFMDSRDEVEAENDDRMQASSELYLVLGEEQLTALFAVISMFTDRNQSTPYQNDERDQNLNSYVGRGRLKSHTKFTPMNFGRNSRSMNKSSQFNLPLLKVQIILPNNTSIRAQKCKFELRTDNSLARVHGTGNILIDNEEFLNEDTCWTVDLKDKEICVDPKGISQAVQRDWGFHSDGIGAQKPIGFHFDHIRCIGSGIAKILEKRREIQRGVDTSTVDPSVAPSNNMSPKIPKWSIKIQGQSQLFF